MPSTTEHPIAIASLETISFSALEKKYTVEIEKLMTASRKAGFYYLDFTGSSAVSLPGQKRDLLKAMEQYFHQSEEEKEKDSRGLSTRGYVKKGTFTGDKLDQPDQPFEHLAISTYELQNDPTAVLPTVFQQAQKLVPDYVKTCQRVVDTLFLCYNHGLGLEGSSELLQYHQHTKAGETILAMLSYPGQLTHQKHTDLGSLTVLFSEQWGLQVVAPTSGEWEWVEPREQDAIIDVGDALRFFSNKELYSCVHRVIRDGRADER